LGVAGARLDSPLRSSPVAVPGLVAVSDVAPLKPGALRVAEPAARADLELEGVRAHITGGLLRSVLAFVPVCYHIAVCVNCASAFIVGSSGVRATLQGGQGAFFLGMRFFPSGSRLLSWSGGELAIVWDADSGSKLHTLRHRREVVVGRPLPCGRAVTCTGDGTCVVWDADSGSALYSFKSPFVHDVEPLMPGDRILTWAFRGPTAVWDVATGTQVCRLPGARSAIYSAEALPDGRRFVTVSRTTRAIIWNARTCKAELSLHHSDIITTVSVVAWGAQIVTLDADGRVDVWSALTGRRLRTLPIPAAMWAHRLYLQPFADDRVLVTDAFGLHIFNTTTAQIMFSVENEEEGGRGAIRAFDVSKAGDLLAACSTSSFTVWDARRGVRLQTFETKLEECLVSIGLANPSDTDAFRTGLAWDELL